MDNDAENDSDAALPALLWDTLPENAENHPDCMAIHSLMYDESTLEEQIENFKEQGNQRLKVALKSNNKLYFQEAIKYYTRGIDVKLEGRPELRSVLFSNRAQAQIHLKNWRKALDDSEAAIKLDATNIKAYYRGAKSALRLDEVATALHYCEAGLSQDPSNKDLVQLSNVVTHSIILYVLAETSAALQDAARRNAVIEEQRKHSEQERATLKRDAEELLAQFAKRNIRLCQSNFKVGKRKPFVDADGVLHWPVLFVYPESMQQDIIEDVSETDLVSELLDVMFSSEAPPLPWDTAREYRRDTIDVYYLANAGEPFSHGEMESVLMGEYHGDPELHAPKIVLKRTDCIVPGVPTFFIVARGSNYHRRFLESVARR